MTFKIVFVAPKLPTQTEVRLVLTDNSTPLATGAMATTLGPFVVKTTSISVGSMTMIFEDDNPTPSEFTVSLLCAQIGMKINAYNKNIVNRKISLSSHTQA